MRMLTRISKRILIHPLLWRIVGIVSSIVAFTCFALSPSFHYFFGRWNLYKIAIYSMVSLIVTTLMLLIKKWRKITRSGLLKTSVGFLVMMLSSLFSIWQDLNSEKEDEEKGYRGRILNMCSFGAFGLMSLSWSRQLQLGFEVGISNFVFGSFLVMLMKMNFILIPVAALFCYMFIYFRYFSDHWREMRNLVDSSETVLLDDIESGNHNVDLQRMNHWREMRGLVDSSDTVLLDDIESGNHNVDLQRMNVAEHCVHKNRLQEHAQRFGIPLPFYQSVKFGQPHAPKFRSAVAVDGKSYTSGNLFPNRKASEQYLAKLALKHIKTGVKDEGLSLILERPTSFKSILRDYAKKMNLEITYNTVPRKGRAGFESSLNFNGKDYIGDPAKIDMDADLSEESAACAAVLSNLESILRFF